MKENINKQKNLMQEKVLIWEVSRRIMVEKQRIVGVFLKELAHQSIEEYIYCYPLYTDILENLERLQTIQIYEDGVIRLDLNSESYCLPKTSIFLDEFKAGYIKYVLEKIFS